MLFSIATGYFKVIAAHMLWATGECETRDLSPTWWSSALAPGVAACFLRSQAWAMLGGLLGSKKSKSWKVTAKKGAATAAAAGGADGGGACGCWRSMRGAVSRLGAPYLLEFGLFLYYAALAGAPAREQAPRCRKGLRLLAGRVPTRGQAAHPVGGGCLACRNTHRRAGVCVRGHAAALVAHGRLLLAHGRHLPGHELRRRLPLICGLLWAFGPPAPDHPPRGAGAVGSLPHALALISLASSRRSIAAAF